MSPPNSVLQELRHLDRSSTEFHDQLSNILYGEEYQLCASGLQDDELVWLVEYLDKALDGLDSSGTAFRKCLRELRTICGSKATLPASYMLSSRLLNIGPDPFASGGYGDVYEGTLNGSRVCVKRVRVYTRDGPEQATKIFCQEAVMWKRLTHPNILPLLGVTITPFQLVSNWMSGGDLPEYIKKYPDADRLGLLSDVAKGLCYLHSCNVIHGDLKGPNILVDDSGHARIADFGLATVTQNLDSRRSVSYQRGHTVRWTAPEVLNEGTYSTEADIFSFAMVMIEVFTGAAPFSDATSVMAMLAITQGRRPPRPTHPSFTEDLWALMERCWDQDPHLRPEVSVALQTLLTPDHPAWKQLISHDLAAQERVSVITTIFSDQNQIETVGQLSGDGAQAFIDIVVEALDALTPEVRGRCLQCLYRVCGRQTLLPSSLVIPLCYDQTEYPLCHGGSADVWKGQYRGREVAAKVLRLFPKDDFGLIKRRFCREIVVWRALRHPNVLPLLGVTITENRLVMVSEWMTRGNIKEFTKADVDANRLELLRDVTRGLIYMHDRGIIHGDLKGANILVDNDGRACLAGFSLLTITSNQSTLTSSAVLGGTPRWMSPELLNPSKFGLKEGCRTKESDCYALGMVIYEVLSEQVPFAPCKEVVVIFKVLGGERPERLQGEERALFTDGVWSVLEHCWKPQPHERISAESVLLGLEDKPFPLRPSFTVDRDAAPSSHATEKSTGGQPDAAGSGFKPHEPPVARIDERAPDPPKMGNPKEGWIGRLAHGAREASRGTIRKLYGP